MARARATRAATSRLPSAGGGRMRSAAVTAGTSMCKSMRSMSGPGQPPLILGGAARVRASLAGKSRLAGAAAAAGVHGGNQHETRGIGHAMVRSRDRDLPDLERLTQRIEHLRLELGQLVDEEDAVMRERDFARPRAQSAADQRRHAGGMMRRAERAAIGE